LEESKGCPEIDTRFVATDETEKKRGTVRHSDFYEGRLTVIKGVDSCNSSERERQTSFKAFRKSFIREFRRQFDS
jgi:hypothetical protein